MRLHLTAATIACASLACAGRAATEAQVRAYLETVREDVTRDGPAAWRKHLSPDDSFFMAVNGRLVMGSGAEAMGALDQIGRDLGRVELTWGPRLRVDPLSSALAVVAAPYHEVRVSTKGERVVEDGFFTATAENRDGRWHLRDAHWSVPSVPCPGEGR